MSEEKKICPQCGNEMTKVYSAIGGFPSHPFIHRGPLQKYRCSCGYEESIEEDAEVQEKREEFRRRFQEALMKNPQAMKIASRKEDRDEEPNK